MQGFLSRKQTVWIIMTLLALLPLPSIVNYMQRFVVRNGVVTAFRYEVHAPIDGVVSDLSISPGMIPGDRPALRLGNKRTMGQYETLEKELKSLETSLAQSQRKFSDYTDRLMRDIEQSLAILKARLRGEQAAQKESRHRLDRTMQLVKASVATQEDGDRVESEFRKADAQVRTTLLEIEQLKHRRRMLGQGMLPQDLSDGALQVQSRINTLQQDILACKRRMSEAETDFAIDAASLKTLETDMNNRAAKASINLLDSAVIWEVDVQNDMEVAKGDRLFSVPRRGVWNLTSLTTTPTVR